MTRAAAFITPCRASWRRMERLAFNTPLRRRCRSGRTVLSRCQWEWPALPRCSCREKPRVDASRVLFRRRRRSPAWVTPQEMLSKRHSPARALFRPIVLLRIPAAARPAVIAISPRLPMGPRSHIDLPNSRTVRSALRPLARHCASRLGRSRLGRGEIEMPGAVFSP